LELGRRREQEAADFEEGEGGTRIYAYVASRQSQLNTKRKERL